METYKIVRFSSKIPRDPRAHLQTRRRTIRTGLTLEEAQAHCSDPATRGKLRGWDFFDGYYRE